MRNVEKQAQALKVALDAATDIQANPNWDYAHIVACIQAAILEVDCTPPTTIPQILVPIQTVENKGYDMVITDMEDPSVTLTVPGHSYTYGIRGDVEALNKLQRAIAISSSNALKKFDVLATKHGITVTTEDMTLPFVPRERVATLVFNKGEAGELIAVDFFKHIFRNSPIKAFPQ